MIWETYHRSHNAISVNYVYFPTRTTTVKCFCLFLYFLYVVNHIVMHDRESCYMNLLTYKLCFSFHYKKENMHTNIVIYWLLTLTSEVSEFTLYNITSLIDSMSAAKSTIKNNTSKVNKRVGFSWVAGIVQLPEMSRRQCDCYLTSTLHS